MNEICGKVWNFGRSDETACHRPKGHELLDDRGCSGCALEGDEIGAHEKHATHVPEYMRKPPRERGTFTVEISYDDGTTENVVETQCERSSTALRRAITSKDYSRRVIGARIVP